MTPMVALQRFCYDFTLEISANIVEAGHTNIENVGSICLAMLALIDPARLEEELGIIDGDE